MVEFKSPIRLIGGEKGDHCNYPLQIDPYGNGCTNKCVYCSDPETLVTMVDLSTKMIKDISVGDKIIGVEHGKYIESVVQNIWTTHKSVYEITLENGMSVKCSGDHRWLTDRGWKHTINTPDGSLDRAHLTFNNSIKILGPQTLVPEITEDFKLGYISGVIRGDGHLGNPNKGSYLFNLRANDNEMVQRTKQFLSEFDIETHDFREKSLYGIRIAAKHTYEKIQELITYRSTPEFYRGFISGIFDAEGSHSCTVLRMCNTDLDILNCIENALNMFKFDYVYDVDKQPANKIVRTIRVRGGLCEHVRFFNVFDIAIKRKSNILGTQVTYKSKVASITKVSDDALLYDIQTSTENFIANGMVSHNCYAQSLLAFRNHWNPESPAETDISKIRKQFETAFNTTKVTKTAEMLRRRVPIRVGGMTDPFLKNEQESRKTLELLEVFKDFQYPYIIFTKGAMVADDEYLELYDPDLTYVQVTITSNNQELVDQIEPNASTTSDRMDAVSKLIEAGIRTGVRIGPIIPIWPDGTLAAGDDPGSASLDYFSFGLVDEICSLAPSIVIAEMCRFTPFIFNQFDAIGINVRQLINEHSITKSATKFISVAERLAYYTRMKETCDSNDVAFSVCELDNFDAFKHLWAIADDCCGMKGTIKGADKTWWSDL